MSTILIMLWHFLHHVLLILYDLLFQSYLFKLNFVQHLLLIILIVNLTMLGWHRQYCLSWQAIFIAHLSLWDLKWNISKTFVLFILLITWLDDASFDHLVVGRIKEFAPSCALSGRDIALFWANAMRTAWHLRIMQLCPSCWIITFRPFHNVLVASNFATCSLKWVLVASRSSTRSFKVWMFTIWISLSLISVVRLLLHVGRRVCPHQSQRLLVAIIIDLTIVFFLLM